MKQFLLFSSALVLFLKSSNGCVSESRPPPVAIPFLKETGVKRFLGKGVTVTDMQTGGDGSAGSNTIDLTTFVERPSDLTCSGDHNYCCWGNAKSADAELRWNRITGSVEDFNYNHFYNWDAKALPKPTWSSFLGAGSHTTRTSGHRAMIVSCPIFCAIPNSIVEVSFAHRLTQGVVVEACKFRPDSSPSPDLTDCVQVNGRGSEVNSPSVVQLQAPLDQEPFQLAIISRNFANSGGSYRDGGAALIHHILVDYEACPPPTTTTTTTEAPPTTTDGDYAYPDEEEYPDEGEEYPDGGEYPDEYAGEEGEEGGEAGGEGGAEEPSTENECKNVRCDFSNGMCGWKDVSTEFGQDDPIASMYPGLSSSTFEYKPGDATGADTSKYRTGNRVSGVRSGPEGYGDGYMGAVLNDQQKAEIVNSVSGGLVEERVFKFSWYMNIAGSNFVTCCDSSCVDLPNTIGGFSWVTATAESSFKCPAGTKTIRIACVNMGRHLGACGIADLHMYSPGFGDAESATDQICRK